MATLDVTIADNVLKNSVLSEMAVDIAVNEKSEVWVLHDKPFSYDLQNIEYHADSGDLYFVTADGHLQHLGMTVPKKTQKRMNNASQAHLFLIPDGEKIKNYNCVSITRKENVG